MALTRRALIVFGLAVAAQRRRRCLRAGQVDHRRLDDVDRAVGAVRPHPADVHEEDGHRRQGRRARAPARRSTSARRGDVDVVFVHDRAAEDKFVAEGCGVDRRDVMYNDFVLIGPKADPAKVAGGKDIARR